MGNCFFFIVKVWVTELYIIFILQVSLYQRAFRAISSFDYFFKRQWLFVGENSVKLWDTLSETDRKLFYFDVKAINWSAYFEIYVLGVRQFILKDDLSTLPKARSNLKKYVTATLSSHKLFIFHNQ